jgi:3-dehydrosphinganine reductase
MNFVAASQFFIEFLVLAIMFPLFGLLAVIITWKLSLRWSQPNLIKSVKGKHCLVTGGSQGLGLATALELVKAGAHVTIVSRSETKLQTAIQELAAALVSSDQKINHKSVDLSSYSETLSLVKELFSDNMQPDWLIANAGSSLPGFLADQLPIKNGNGPHEWLIDSNYYSAINIVRAFVEVARLSSPSGKVVANIAENQAVKLPQRIVLVGSVMSLLSMIGYTAYAGSKYALRGFADGLRQELKPLGIRVTLYMPGNMNTPGFESENSIKPHITKEIEGASTPVTAESAAKDLLSSTLSNRFYTTNDMLGELARVSVNGGQPRPNLIFEVRYL